MTITPNRILRKSSDETYERNVRYEANATNELIPLMFGGKTQSVTKQTTALLKSTTESDRNTIITAMKFNLKMPWNQLREISR